LQINIIRLLLALLPLCLVACATPDIGGPAAPQDDPEAGSLRLPSGTSIAVYPSELGYTGQAGYRWPDGRTYEGDWVDGLPEGIGTESRPDGESYKGTFQSGLRDGHGELTLPDGSRYVGDFSRGARSGEGTLRAASGIFRGQWLDDQPEGFGEYHGNDGTAYRGMWVRGMKTGYGSYTAANGYRYDGDWSADQPDGFGEMETANGSSYAGSWQAGLRSGYGRAVAPGNLVYEGTWVADKRQGYGLETRPDGSSYQGEWLADKRDGQGREQNADGTYHDGAWEQNRALGPGIRSDLAGIETSGIWNGDLVSNGLIILPTGLEYAGPLFREFNTRVSPRLQKWMHDAASRGDPYAQLTLGKMYLDYSDPAPDQTEARRWLKQAAEAGIAEAMYRLAITWAEDNPSRTVALLAEAAGKGHPGANEILGEYYQLGIGVPRNLQTAMRYFEQGMEAGSLRCRNQLAWLLATIDDAEIRNPSRAIEIIGPIALYSGSWQYLDTLAAGHAAAGHYKVAIRILRQALAAAASDTAADNELKQLAMQQRLTLYESGKSFIEP
jgi:hypothetical protein